MASPHRLAPSTTSQASNANNVKPTSLSPRENLAEPWYHIPSELHWDPKTANFTSLTKDPLDTYWNTGSEALVRTIFVDCNRSSCTTTTMLPTYPQTTIPAYPSPKRNRPGKDGPTITGPLWSVPTLLTDE